MPLQRRDTGASEKDADFLSPVAYDDDASSLHSRSDRDTDSEDDEVLAAARNSRELRARDRMILLDEDEMDDLVIKSRKANQGRDRRRSSNLSVPNPMRMFRKTSKDNLRQSAIHEDAGSSVEDLRDEKRRAARRDRRKKKRERLMKEAQDGEDGELMQEMEGGAMKYGSSTAESSERDDSEELDRWRLKHHTDTKTAKSKLRKRLFITFTVLVGLAFVILLLWKIFGQSDTRKQSTIQSQNLVSNGTALFGPTTLILSLDGFRADFLERGITPRLDAFVKEGVSPLYMTPSFPSVTFPNHYTLATGLYPESHGVVGNTFWDPDMNADFYYTDPDRSLDSKWWGGEPFWVTAEQQGIRTAVHMWPGSEAHIMDMDPTYLDKFNGKEKLPKKVDRILELLDKPGMEDRDALVDEMRPQLIAAYVPNVDAFGHKFGPNSTEVRDTIQQVDTMLDMLFHGLEQRNLTDIVNVIIVSDHGMATTDVSRMIQVDDLIDMDKVERVDGWPLVGIRPKDPMDLGSLHSQVLETTKGNPNLEVYMRDVDMPERYHFTKSDRIAPLWIIPKTGWAVVQRLEFDIEDAKKTGKQYNPRGMHGYDHEHPLMRAIFVARGPAFPHEPHSKVETFQNIEVYNLLCDSIGIKPVPNNGTLHLPLKTVGLHEPGPVEQPSDPVPPYTLEGEEDSADSDPAAPVPTEPDTQPPQETAAVGIDPVVGESHDEEEKPTSAEEGDGDNSGSGSSNSNEESNGDGEQKGSWWDGIKSTWNNITHKVHDFFGKMTGGKKDQDKEGSS